MSINLKGKERSITVLHILGMAMILFCHIFQDAGISFLGELLIAGVPLFLFVAGYLSGKKKITNSLEWVGRRLLRLLVPFYILLVTLFIIYEIFNVAEVSSFQWIFCSLNLQGLNYTYWKFDLYGSIPGTGPFWFLTTIMFAYFLTPLLNKFRDIDLTAWKKIILVVSLICVQILAMFFGVQLNYLLVYVMGYFTGVKGVRQDGKYYFIINIMTVVITAVRFVLRVVIDGSDFYDRFYALISSTAIALWIFYTVFYLEKKIPNIFLIADKKWILFVETISFYIYLVHYLFLRSPFGMKNYISNLILADILMIICSFLAAIFLWYIAEKIIIRYVFTKRASKEQLSGETK